MPVTAAVVTDLVWPHAVFSQRATCPPSAAVRQRSIAPITFNWPRLTCPRLASRQPDRDRGNIRDLEIWSSHGALWRRRLLLVSPRRPAARFAQASSGSRSAIIRSPHDCSGCRLKPVVSEQSCNQTNILARSSRWVAKLWRSECREMVLRSPRLRGFLETAATDAWSVADDHCDLEQPALLRVTPASSALGRAFHHCRNKPGPLPAASRIGLCGLSTARYG